MEIESSIEASMPMCDKCSTQPLPLTMHMVNTPTGIILGVVTCNVCGHVIQVLALGTSQPTIVSPTGKILHN